MRRTREWWSRLDSQERSELHWLERGRSSLNPYIPDDCSECGNCGIPHLGYGLCPLCLDRKIKLIRKGNGEVDDD